jgi:thiol-disulfide isomerase/thioredoxin
MREMKNYVLLVLIPLLMLPVAHSQGYTIDLEAPDFSGKEVILVEYFASRMVPLDTVLLNDNGNGSFRGDSLLDGGLYLIYFDQDNYFDFLIGDDQEMKIQTSSPDYVNNTRFSGNKNNEIFFQYKQFLSRQKEKMNGLSSSLEAASSVEDSLRIRTQMEQVNQEMKSYSEQIIEDHPDLFVSTFLRAMKDVEVPKELLTGSDRQVDSVRYYYYKKHYFDHFDITDIRLLHTPLYDPKIKKYVNQVVPQHPDSLIRTVDFLVEASRAHPAIFRYMLITLFNNAAESKLMGMDKVYFHLAERYYIPEATWSDPKYIEDLKENLEKHRYTFINDPAQDFSLIGLPEQHFSLAQMDTAIKRDPYVGYEFNLYGIQAKYTILYFWESDCGHCKKSTPALYEVFEKYKDQGVQVLAVHVINSVEGKEKWIDFVNEYGLYDWINCWSPFSNDFRKLYNLSSFPQMFILDQDKTIVAKKISPEQADDILGRLLNK